MCRAAGEQLRLHCPEGVSALLAGAPDVHLSCAAGKAAAREFPSPGVALDRDGSQAPSTQEQPLEQAQRGQPLDGQAVRKKTHPAFQTALKKMAQLGRMHSFHEQCAL